MIIIDLILRSFFSPKVVLDYVVKMKLEWRVVIEAVLFVSITNTLLTHTFNSVVFSTNQSQEKLLEPYIDIVLNRPVFLSIIEIIKVFFITSLLTYGGRLFSGSGSFLNVLKGVTWIHFILIFINIGLFVVIQLNITLASYLIIITNFWIMWVLSECAVRTHGFKSTFRVLIVGIILFILVLALFISLAGFLGFNFLEEAGSSA